MNNTPKIKIYCLSDPRNGEIKYIGITSKKVEDRLKKHLTDNSNWLKRRWIKELKNNGLIPIIKEIDSVDFNEWIYWECWYIELFKYYGCRLFNLTSGGDGIFGYKHTEETKKIIKEKRKKQIFTEETKKTLSKVRMQNKYAKGTKHSEEKNKEKSKRQRGKFGGTILRTDTNGEITEYKSIKDAGDSIGVSYKEIWYFCTKKKGKLYRGFFWEYKNNNKQQKNFSEIDYEYLYTKYVIEKKSGKKIGEELNCSGNKVYRYLKKYNLLEK